MYGAYTAGKVLQMPRRNTPWRVQRNNKVNLQKSTMQILYNKIKETLIKYQNGEINEAD